VSEANTELVNLAMRTFIKDGENAFIVLDKEGKIRFLSKKAARLTGRSENDLMEKDLTYIVNIESKKRDLTALHESRSEEFLKVRIKNVQGEIPAEMRFKPISIKGKFVGSILVLKSKAKRSEYLSSLEALGSIVQRHSNAQKIYETLGEELNALQISLMVFHHKKERFTLEHHTLDSRKTRLTEFIMGLPLDRIKLKIRKDEREKMEKQKYLFFYDIFSILEIPQSESAASELHRFLSVSNLSKGVAVPVILDGELTGLMVLFSDELAPGDAAIISALGVQVSAALERAHHFEQLVSDLKALEEQISSRTQELEKVKSQMESIVQSSVDAIMATDTKGSITFVNDGVETMFGYTEKEILGQVVTKYYAEGQKEAKKLRDTVMQQGRIENAELDFLAKGNRLVHTLASFSLLKDEKGTVSGIMAVLKDITEQKRLQQTIESLNAAAFRIQKSRTKEEIFMVTAEELKRFEFYVIFMLFDENKTSGRIVYITEEEMLKTLYGREGKKPPAYETPLTDPIYRNVIKKKKATYVGNLQTVMKLVIPASMQKASEGEIDLSGMTNKKSILAPLVIHGETAGLLGVISDFITLQDIPSIMAFANQVSTALENARLLEESQNRADELARNLEEQQLLRELNTKLFLARSQDEVLDAAIEGIHKLGKSFSTISILNEDKTHATIVRLEIEGRLLKITEKILQLLLPDVTLLGHQIPLKEDTVYSQFFANHIPLVTSNVEIHAGPVMKTELSQIYTGLAAADSALHTIVRKIPSLLPYRSVMIFPIIVGGNTIGTLAVTSEDIFSENSFMLMRTVAEMVSSAMERIGHSKKLAETLNELRAVQKINTLLNMGAPLEHILTQISSSIEEVYHYRFAFPLLLDPSGRYLMFSHVLLPLRLTRKIEKVLGTNLRDFRYPVSEDLSFFKTVIKEKRCLLRKGFEELGEQIPIDRFSSIVKNLSPELSKGFGLNSGDNSIMIAPLSYGEDVIGVLFLGHQKSLNEEDYQRLEYFLDQVGIAMAKSEVEHRLRQSLKELRELDQMKSEFIDIASHELRTPLTTLKLYLEMMAMEQYGKLSEPLRERIRVMEDGVNRLEEIINQTLVASRLLKNKLELEEGPVSLMNIATEVVRQLRPLWKSKSQNIFLESLPRLSRVKGDRKALFTVVNNLVDNAIRYSPENTEIFIKFTDHPDAVECVVIDQGCGIPPEHIAKIFDEFYIVPSATEYARMDGRTGLGLFIAKGIVERHGGEIWVESVPGRGSTFHFAVPKGKHVNSDM
jgi:PAS domain S-box-containing protein